MAHVRFIEIAWNLASHLDQVIESRTPLLVTRQGHEAAYVIAEGEFESMQETLAFPSQPSQRRASPEGIAQLEKGERVEHDPTI